MRKVKTRTLAADRRDLEKANEEVKKLEEKEKHRLADEEVVKYLRNCSEAPPEALKAYCEVCESWQTKVNKWQAKIAGADEKMKLELREKFKDDPGKAALPEDFRKLFG